MTKPTKHQAGAQRFALSVCPTKRIECQEAGDFPEGIAPGGRWNVYNGGFVSCHMIDEHGWWIGANVLIELSSLTVKDKVPALADHDTWTGPIGQWSEIDIQASNILGDLVWFLPRNEVEAELWSFKEAVRMAGLADRGFDWQASVGVGDGSAESLIAGSAIEANGTTHQVPDNGLPSFILRNGKMDEISVLLFGADSDTGKIAAKRFAALLSPSNKDPKMTKAQLGPGHDALRVVIEGRVTEEMDLAAVVADLAEQAGVDVDVINGLLDESIEKPTLEQLASLTEALELDLAETATAFGFPEDEVAEFVEAQTVEPEPEPEPSSASAAAVRRKALAGRLGIDEQDGRIANGILDGLSDDEIVAGIEGTELQAAQAKITRLEAANAKMSARLQALGEHGGEEAEVPGGEEGELKPTGDPTTKLGALQAVGEDFPDLKGLAKLRKAQEVYPHLYPQPALDE